MANISQICIFIVLLGAGLVIGRPDVLDPTIKLFEPHIEPHHSTVDTNKVTRSSSSSLQEIDGKQVLVTQGSFSYEDDEGRASEVNYLANENGYQAKFVITSHGGSSHAVAHSVPIVVVPLVPNIPSPDLSPFVVPTL